MGRFLLHFAMQSFLFPETHTHLGQLFLPGLFSCAALRSVARLYDEKGKPGSSYFFDRYEAKNRTLGNCERLMTDRFRHPNRPWNNSSGLSLNPVYAFFTTGPLVVVVDALGEGTSGYDARRKHLLNALSSHITEQRLSTNLRCSYLVTGN